MQTTSQIGQTTIIQNNLEQFERNKYFYGKLLDAYHFELETNYHNAKRYLINRAILGYGVVCGLDVIPVKGQPHSIAVTPGFAIDKWGRELIVPGGTPLRPLQIPPEVIAKAKEMHEKDHYPEPHGTYHEPPHHGKDKICIQVMICYRECETDPVPVLAGDCHSADPCAPGTIRESYQIKFTHWCEHPDNDQCRIPHIASDGKIDYQALVKWVTRERDCLALPKDPCIRLAHLHLSHEEAHECDHDDIDITVRPIVYANDLLFDILLGWQTPGYGRRDK